PEAGEKEDGGNPADAGGGHGGVAGGGGGHGGVAGGGGMGGHGGVAGSGSGGRGGGSGALQPNGAPCASSAQCTSGVCADGSCCDVACGGACRSCNQPGAVGSCRAYASGTDPERECTTGSTCNGAGACVALPDMKKANGQPCSGATQCVSGFCADGVCCNTACGDACQSCTTGTCLAVKRADDAPQCTGTKTCNPKGECVAR
ncbi:MAG TPA: hypothetical protein VIU64_01155, partial [Polyangia bacterium]